VNLDRIVALLMDGMAETARDELKRGLSGSGGMPHVAAMLGCAEAILGNTREAESHLAAASADAQSDVGAIRLTGLAYLAEDAGDHAEALSLLEEAAVLDPNWPLAIYSLALHWLWKERDYQQAGQLLDKAMNLAPDSSLVKLAKIGLAVERGEVQRARDLLGDYGASLGPKTPVLGLRLLLIISATPLGGGLLALALGLATFIHYLGPLIPMAGVVLSVAAYSRIRRVSLRLALLPAVFTLSVVAVFAIRVIVVRSVWP
jgi:tetratricopeptide (TPR) repeat protein